MNMLCTGLLLGSLAAGSAAAADYSIGIVDDGTGFAGAGTALNLYAITNRGVDLLPGSPYVFPKRVPGSGNRYEPAAVAISPTNEFAYVVYIGVPNLPILVQFKITPNGLAYQWEQEVSTGDVSLQGSSISTVSNYLIEDTYPALGLWVHILNQSGHELISDAGTDGNNLVSGHIDPNGEFYYSCRYISHSNGGVGGPANSVAVYKLGNSVTDGAPPLVTSTDPAFIQSECSQL